MGLEKVHLQRRSVVRILVLATAALAMTRAPVRARFGTGTASTGSGAPAGLSLRAVRRRVSALFPEPASAALVGERYLARSGHPPPARDLLLETGIDFANVSGPDLRAAFAAARERDFAAGNVVELDGWVLARSEAACCALLAAS